GAPTLRQPLGHHDALPGPAPSEPPAPPPAPPPARTPARRWFGRSRATAEAAPASPYAAEVRALAVTRDRVRALRRVDLTVSPGETVALMGRNGAGKSTLLNALVGLVTPSSGTVLTGG
ncbi:ATP-binding cassette domain-containing protein, partial [Streptomyces sp. NRRL WC-3605]|uniref:ATP-binding cassette domain-containing protein n=1 Tax=Streptomyces sp. NRRL WC-3605 TaxID=1609103 RepID=UPI000AB97CCC